MYIYIYIYEKKKMFDKFRKKFKKIISQFNHVW